MGSITLSIAKKASQVIGIEIVESAVDDARENAEKNNIKARFVLGSAEEAIEKLWQEEKNLSK